jgi:hypothetical protein
MRRFTTTTTTTTATAVTITNGIVVALIGGYTTPHATLRAADCDAGPMNGDNNIIQLIRGTTRYYSTIYTRRRDIARTRDEEDTKVRYNDQHCEDQLYCEEE